MTDPIAKEFFEAIKHGARLGDAARAMGIDIQEIKRMQRDDQRFAQQTRQARARCKLDQLKRLAQAKGWQAPVFLLERKWPVEFGRRKPSPAPAPPEKVHRFPLRIDLSFLSAEDQRRVFEAIRDATPIDDDAPCPMKQLPDLSSAPPSTDATRTG